MFSGCVCPLGRLAGLVLTGDGTQPGLGAVSGGLKAAALRSRRLIVTSPVVAAFPDWGLGSCR